MFLGEVYRDIHSFNKCLAGNLTDFSFVDSRCMEIALSDRQFTSSNMECDHTFLQRLTLVIRDQG